MTEAQARALPSTPQRRVPPRELPDAGRLTYVLRQRFSYTYDAPVRDLDHRLVVVPPRRHGDQRRRRHSITVSAADARTTHRRDAAGNIVTRSRVPLVPDRVEFVVDAVVERVGPGTDVLVPAAALTDSRLLRPTRLTAADAAIRRLAATMADQDRLATADRFCAYVHEAIRYAYGATSVATTAAEALASGQGVCQDAARAVALDPCNGCRVGANYLTVATGRDYTDVAPTSGTYLGTARGNLTAIKQVDIALP